MYLRSGMWLGLALACLPVTQRAHAYEVDKKHRRVVVSSIADFERCQDELSYSDACLEALKVYTKAHPNDAFAAGKSVRLHFNHWVALPFFAGALDKEKANNDQCGDEDLSMAVVSGLALPSDDPNLALANKIAEGRCFSSLQPALQKQLKDGGGYYLEHGCALLQKKNVNAAECAPAAPAKPAAPAPARSAKLGGLNPRSLPTDPSSAVAFRGEENEQVLLVRAKAPHDDVVLLKFRGVRGPWNNQILAAVEAVNGRDKEYVASVDGKDYVVMTLDSGSYEAYPKGYRDSLRLSRERLADQHKAIDSGEVLKEFAQPPQPAKK